MSAATSSLIEDKWFQSQLNAMDKDSDVAEKAWKATVGHGDLKLFPSDLLKEYKADGAREIKARDAFNLEWNKVVAGKSDNKRLLVAYDKYSVALAVLQTNNARFEALLDAQLAKFAAGFAALVLLMIKNGSQRAKELYVELEALETALKKAKKEIKEAEAQRILNGLLSVVTLCLGPAGMTARILLGAGSITAHLIIDASLGPSSGSGKGTVVTIAGDAADGIEKLGKVGKKLAGAGGALLTFSFDSDEIDEAKRIYKEVQAQFKRTARVYQALMGALSKLVPKARQIQRSLQGAIAAAQKAMAVSSDKSKTYESIKKHIKKAK